MSLVESGNFENLCGVKVEAASKEAAGVLDLDSTVA